MSAERDGMSAKRDEKREERRKAIRIRVSSDIVLLLFHAHYRVTL